jgi:hypothetical protein
VSSCSALHEPERRGARLRADDAADDALGRSAVLRAVRGVELVVDVFRLDEENVFVDTAGLKVGFVPGPGAAEPGRPAPGAGTVARDTFS